MTLRPEGTAPVCRAYVEHGMHKLRRPVRLWYLSSFFRHERAQAGRYRQFWQVGAEALGSEDPAVDAESICLLAALLDELGVASVRLRLSSLGSLAARQEYREQLQAYLREHADTLSEDVRARIELNPLRAFDSEHPGTRGVMQAAPLLGDFLSAEDAEHFAEVRARLDAAGVAYELDHTLVRGLDYYTRTVFEFTSDALGAQSGVGGGGRYDGFVEQLGGPPTPGIGWAAGIERILLAGGVPAGAGALRLWTCSLRMSLPLPALRTATATVVVLRPMRQPVRSRCSARLAPPGSRRRWSSPDARSKASWGMRTRSARATSRSWGPAVAVRPRSETCSAAARTRSPLTRSCTRFCVACARSEAVLIDPGESITTPRVQLSRPTCRSRG